MSFRKRAVLSASVCAVALVAVLFLVVSTRMWQRLDIDPDWANRVIADSGEVRRMLDAYRADHGEFPESLARLPLKYREPPAFGASGTVDQWHYGRLSKSDYQLYATGKSFISSYDAVVFRHSGSYPAEWFKRFDSLHTKRFGDWCYITGFSSLEKTP